MTYHKVAPDETPPPAAQPLRMDGTRVVAEEVKRTAGGAPKNNLAHLSWRDRIGYVVENRIAANPNYPFKLLALCTAACLAVFGVGWYQISKRITGDTEVFGSANVYDAIFLSLQLVISAGYDADIPDKLGLRWLYFVILFFGLVVFAVLVGFITDAVSQFMNSLEEGRTKVAADGHTLLLGWNEATLRCVVQIAFLRRQYQMLNERKCFGLMYYLPFLLPVLRAFGVLERPSTSLAVSDIIIMCDSHTKEEMHELLAQTLDERGINPRRTKLGKNIICRIGDPTNVNDLIRVGAHRAAAILVMMTERDANELEESDGQLHNGATLRTALAIRHVLFTNPYSGAADVHPELRVVMQMSSASAYVDAACFTHANGDDAIIPMDLSRFLNSLMFICAAQPGLSRILLSMLDFEGKSIRRRRAKNLRSGPNRRYGACVGKTFGETAKEFKEAVLIGIIRTTMPDEEMRANGFGLCPDPDVVIQPEDLIIFIGQRSSPVGGGRKHRSAVESYVKEAGLIATEFPEIERDRAANAATKTKTRANLLVCGWRHVWEDSPRRLFARIAEVAKQRLAGSEIIFVNAVPPGEFGNIMREAGLRPAGDGRYALPQPYEGVTVRHVHGDAAKPAVLTPIVNDVTVNTAIVLGTQANVRLSGHHRDTRVLNILLLLRMLWATKNEGVPMHVVGENTEDMTARLALAPKRARGSGPCVANASASTKPTATTLEHEPDFVNSQALTARALVQTLAYPLIQPAVKDLFSDDPESASFASVDAREYVPLDRTMRYGVVSALVAATKGDRSICVGILWSSGASELLPAHTRLLCFARGDRLILIRRDVDE